MNKTITIEHLYEQVKLLKLKSESNTLITSDVLQNIINMNRQNLTGAISLIYNILVHNNSMCQEKVLGNYINVPWAKGSVTSYTSSNSNISNYLEALELLTLKSKSTFDVGCGLGLPSLFTRLAIRTNFTSYNYDLCAERVDVAHKIRSSIGKNDNKNEFIEVADVFDKVKEIKNVGIFYMYEPLIDGNENTKLMEDFLLLVSKLHKGSFVFHVDAMGGSKVFRSMSDKFHRIINYHNGDTVYLVL